MTIVKASESVTITCAEGRERRYRCDRDAPRRRRRLSPPAGVEHDIINGGEAPMALVDVEITRPVALAFG